MVTLCSNGRSLPMNYFEHVLLKWCAHVCFDNSYEVNESYESMFNCLIANKLWLLSKYVVPSRGKALYLQGP